MGLRYVFLAIVNLVAGGFLVVSTYGFTTDTAVSLGFAVSIGVAVIGLAMVYLAVRGERKIGPGVLGALTALLAAWTIVATAGTFPDDTARWLVFASGLGHVGLSLISLIVHELTTERIVHHLEVEGRGRRRMPVS